MRRVGVDEIVALQRSTECVRNICVLAHIDHGKTTLTDSLVCSNGIISPKLAGRLRFMDSMEDEQQRGITMHSSAISLVFSPPAQKGAPPAASSEAQQPESSTKPPTSEFLINLIDSPGHIDFSSDVSTATRLCDGALIVVDVLEGVCTQTHAVVYKALKEGLTPCLVLNKLDRLCLELQLTSTEAFHHLRRLLENINALTYTLVNSERHAAESSGTSNGSTDEAMENAWNFSPAKGNVVFASAFDTWGFGLAKFVNLWARRRGLSQAVLQQYLFEDYCLSESTGRICKYDASDPSARPMFAALVLDPLWRLYAQCVVEGDVKAGADAFCKEFGVEVPPREVNVRDGRGTVRALLRAWLPLSDALLRMVVRVVPDPAEAQRRKLDKLISDPGGSLAEASPARDAYADIVRGVAQCSAQGETVVFVSKMVPVRVSELRPEDLAMLNREARRRDPESVDLDPLTGETLMALGRVFSGAVRRDSRLWSLSHRHAPLLPPLPASLDDPPEHFLSSCARVTASSLGVYLCFGPSVLPVDEVPAGNIVGIVGVADFILKTGTLASSWLSPALRAMTFQAKPIVRVAVEPVNYYDLSKLERGLRLLYQYDPAVEVAVDDSSGQNTMACLGEIHQEQCVKYLVEKFARCAVKVSEPIVPFLETLLLPGASFKPFLPQPWRDLLNPAHSPAPGRLWMHSPALSVLIRCAPLDEQALLMAAEDPALKAALALWSSDKYHGGGEPSRAVAAFALQVARATSVASECLESEALLRLVCVGPEEGDGLCACTLAEDFSLQLWRGDKVDSAAAPDAVLGVSEPRESALVHTLLGKIHAAVCAGFQLCCSAGPLMAEPMHGVCFVLEKVLVCASSLLLSEERLGLLFDAGSREALLASRLELGVSMNTGQLISDLRDSFRAAYLTCPLRILEPVYRCSLQCDQLQLGPLYSVLSRRRGQVLSEDIIEGTSLFVLAVALPIIESFGFSQELLKQTSGSATAPLLVFSHFQVIDMDPFWRPTTEEEMEEFGDMTHSHNMARQLLDRVRRRKGLAVEEKIVEFAEKQRTLNKKK